MNYTLPRNIFINFQEVFGKEKADSIARELQQSIGQNIGLGYQNLKNSLKDELVTKELFEERFKLVDERFKLIDERFKTVDQRFASLDLQLKLLIGLVILFGTVLNPNLLSFIAQMAGK